MSPLMLSLSKHGAGVSTVAIRIRVSCVDTDCEPLAAHWIRCRARGFDATRPRAVDAAEPIRYIAQRGESRHTGAPDDGWRARGDGRVLRSDEPDGVRAGAAYPRRSERCGGRRGRGLRPDLAASRRVRPVAR